MSEAVIVLKNIYTRNRTIFQLLLKILISTGILALILSQINLYEITWLIKTSNKLFILMAFSLSMGNIFLQYLKWKLVCNNILNEHNKNKILDSLLTGFSAGSFTPARIGEYFGRAVPFTNKPLLLVTAATIIDKLFTMAIVSIIGLISFLFYVGLYSGISGAIIISGTILYFLTHREKMNKNNPVLVWLLKFKKVTAFYDRLSFIRINYKTGLRLTIISLLFYVCFVLQFALLISAFTYHSEYLNYLWAGSLVMFFKTIVPAIAFGDLGVREGASVYFITHFGGPAAAGFNASILLFIINDKH